MITFDSSGNTHLLWEQDSEAWYLKIGERYIRTYIPDSFEGTPGNPYYKGIAAEINTEGSEATILLIETTQGSGSNRVFINYTVNPENGHLTGAYDINGNFLSIETSRGVDALNSFENKWDEKTTPRAEKEFKSLFDKILNPRDTEKDTDIQDFSIENTNSTRIGRQKTNFNPHRHPRNHTDSFGIDRSATFALVKTRRQ